MQLAGMRLYEPYKIYLEEISVIDNID